MFPTSILAAIILFSFLGTLISVVLAAFVANQLRASWINMLVSYAVGAMLSAAFFEVLPSALAHNPHKEQVCIEILVGLLVFFVLEKLVIWRHCHEDSCEIHAQIGEETHLHYQQVRSSTMMLIGDVFHNFIDGALIATAFLVDIKLGVVTSLAIIAHKIPQEVGDFLILLHAGYSRIRALAFNLASSMATLAGGLVTYFVLGWVQQLMPIMLSFATASLVYVALADIIPSLHRRIGLRATCIQVLLIVLGVSTVWSIHSAI